MLFRRRDDATVPRTGRWQAVTEASGYELDSDQEGTGTAISSFFLTAALRSGSRSQPTDDERRRGDSYRERRNGPVAFYLEDVEGERPPQRKAHEELDGRDKEDVEPVGDGLSDQHQREVEANAACGSMLTAQARTRTEAPAGRTAMQKLP